LFTYGVRKKSVEIARRVLKETNDDTAGIDPGCISEGDSGKVERREFALLQHETMSDMRCVDVTTDVRALQIGTAG